MELQQLLSETAQRKASDLHLKSGSKPILRIHGHLEVQDDLPMVTREFIDKMAESLLGERRVNMLMEGREMDLGYMLPGIGRFRCNLFLAMGEVRGVFRHVPERIPAFQELHLPKVLERLCLERRGMVLVTGITGSGKSTTLAAMLDYMNRTRNDHIVTIEDPVEFVHEDKKCVISQREIGQDSTSFAQALRAALRQDPDIILVGEMRDAETARIDLRVCRRERGDDAAARGVPAHPGLVGADCSEAAEVRGRAGRDVVPGEHVVVSVAVIWLRRLRGLGGEGHAHEGERAYQRSHEQNRSSPHRGKYYRSAGG